MGEQMQFHNKVEDFIEEYSFNDKNEVYTNGSKLIPVFRVEQMIEHYFKNKSEVRLCSNCPYYSTECEIRQTIGNLLDDAKSNLDSILKSRKAKEELNCYNCKQHESFYKDDMSCDGPYSMCECKLNGMDVLSHFRCRTRHSKCPL